MKLDFNFDIENFNGQIQATAKQAMIAVLELGFQNDEKYLDKVELWGKSLIKNGTIECDIVDVKQLKQFVLESRGTFNLAKIPLKNYIQKRIKDCEVPDKKDPVKPSKK